MTWTEKWNPLDFQCTWHCAYCPEKSHSKTPILLPEEDSKIQDHYAIWVNETTDMFCPEVPDSMIETILERASQIGRSKCFLICTKNPARFHGFLDKLPPWSFVITTVESDIDHGWSGRAPPPLERLEEIRRLKFAMSDLRGDHQTCICVQPVMKFTENFVELLRQAMPDQVSFGMELTGLKKFPSPEFSEVMELARAVSEFAEVNVHEVGVDSDTYLDDWPEREEKCSEVRKRFGLQ